MAGQISDDSVIWVAGEASGKDEHGAVVTVASAVPDELLASITYGAGVPATAPASNKGPFYMDSANHKLYSWNTDHWIQVSGWNS